MAEIGVKPVDSLAAFDEAGRAFPMTEETFHVFYDQTARTLWAYLVRATGDPRLADDLLQESYYRFLRAAGRFATEEHRRHYLFRIATNLVLDHRRRRRRAAPDAPLEIPHAGGAGSGQEGDARAVSRIDLVRALQRLGPRQRALLWLAYAQGCSHEEIAARMGIKTASLKSLLHRARRKLATLLRQPSRGGRS
jgi:RNA polymerase sigma-70 factor (ECF subfamily)